jgi:hypothetical protein
LLTDHVVFSLNYSEKVVLGAVVEGWKKTEKKRSNRVTYRFIQDFLRLPAPYLKYEVCDLITERDMSNGETTV